MNDRELTRAMIEAARLATEECVARGYSRSDRVTRDSARRASEEVYLAEQGPYVEPDPTPRKPLPDPWQDRADLG